MKLFGQFLVYSIFLTMAFLISTPSLFAINVGGNITEDTVWTTANSPYVVTSTVQILGGVKLVIEPGVTIKFNYDTGMFIGGELRAVGSENDTILFTSNLVNPSEGDWNTIKFVDTSIDAKFDGYGNYLHGSILEHCKIEYGKGVHAEKSSPAILDCHIANNDGILAAICIDHSTNETIIRGNIISSNSAYRSGGSNAGGILVWFSNGNTIIENNTISNNSTQSNYSGGGILVAHSSFGITGNTIENNLVSNTITTGGSGIYINHSSGVIERNIIINNRAGNLNVGGIYVKRDTSSSTVTVFIKTNNIFNNDNYDILNASPINIGGTNNYWGTTDTALIDAKIHDYYDDMSYGKVTYKPIATQPIDFSGGSISGVITNSLTDEVILGATVFCQAGSTTTDNLGKYKIEYVSPGDYALTVTAPKCHTETIDYITVESGETTTLNISLEPKTTGIVTGQVLSAVGLAPISNASIQLTSDTNTISTTSDSGGDFTFNGISYGTYSIKINNLLYWSKQQTITVEVDETTQITLVGIPQNIVTEIRDGWFTQEQKDQAVAAAKATKDIVIAERDQTITGLNTTIAAMFTQKDFDEAIHKEMVKYDPNGDGKIGMDNVLYYMNVLSGMKGSN